MWQVVQLDRLQSGGGGGVVTQVAQQQDVPQTMHVALGSEVQERASLRIGLQTHFEIAQDSIEKPLTYRFACSTVTWQQDEGDDI